MSRLLVLAALVLAACRPLAAAEPPVRSAQWLKAYRSYLAQPGCAERVIGLQGLVDEVPPLELFPYAWECSQDAADIDVRRAANEVLRKIVNRRDRVLVPLILDTLSHLGKRDGCDLTSALGGLDPPVREAIPVLVALLSSLENVERTPRCAVTALGWMGPAALPAVPDIVALLGSKADVDTREAAAEALGRSGPKGAPAAVPALTKSANDSWPKVRRASLTALGEMGPAASDAVPVLRAALKDPDGWISTAARNALFRVQPDKRADVAAIADAARPEERGSLFQDLSQLSATLPGRVPEVYELVVYDKFAMATAPWAASRSGRGKFTYRAGTVTGPDEESANDCDRKVVLSTVDFSLVPGLVRQAPGLLGSPSGKVSVVILGGGVFCRSIGWIVHVDGAGYVEFRLDGKVGKVQKT